MYVDECIHDLEFGSVLSNIEYVTAHIGLSKLPINIAVLTCLPLSTHHFLCYVPWSCICVHVF